MSKGLGRIERVIAREIEDAYTPRHGSGPSSVHVSSWDLAVDLFYPKDGSWNTDWSPTAAQRKAVSRAMHSFVRKHPQYALTGGQGRKRLYLYEPSDPLSTMWAKMSVEQRHHVSRSMAQAALDEPHHEGR